jgi:[protein-PII] uridylyltransferase
VARLEDELTGRHKRFGDSIYLLEPDVKCGAGGLRDLDIALWAARARFRTTGIDDLRTLGVLSAAEASDLHAAKDFLWALRNHLHRHANRRSDRLTFEEQEAISGLMGYRERDATDDEVIGAAVEAFMSDYYRHARVVLRLMEQIIGRATPPVHRRRPHIVDLDDGVQLFNGQVTVTRAGDLETDPALAFRLYVEAVQRDTTLLPFARDLVVRAASKAEFCEALRRSPEAARRFVELVSTSRKSAFRNGSVLTELHDTGLLTAMIPELLPVVGRVHHDVYHVYTVDVHSVAAVDFLRALARGELAEEHPLASSIAADVTRPEVLCLATLLHDIGKDFGGRDHCQRGADLAAEILPRLGFPPRDVADVCNLILQHLVMYRAAARRDLEDPATISEFAQIVHGREGLRHLFLLTVADLSTTSPTSMTKWKRHMLDDLFRVTDEVLSRPYSAEAVEHDAVADSTRLSGVRAAVHAYWKSTEDAAFLDEYLNSMPQGYLLSSNPEAIAWHARVARRAHESVIVAEIVPSRRKDVTALCVATGDRVVDPLCVIAKDQPGLLASIAAAITAASKPWTSSGSRRGTGSKTSKLLS